MLEDDGEKNKGELFLNAGGIWSKRKDRLR